MQGRIPGFKFNARRQQAKFEAILPGTGATKRKRKTVSARTRDEALAKWKAWRERVLGGEPTSDTTLQSYTDRIWPRTLSRLSKKTVKREEWILKKCLLPKLGPMPLRTVRDATVRDLAGELVGEKYAPATVNGIVALLGKIMRDAWERELIPSVPIHRLPRQRVESLRLEFSPEEQRRFLAAFDDAAGFQLDLAKFRITSVPVVSPFFSGPRPFGGSIRPEGEAAGFLFQQFRRSKPLFAIALETGLTRGDLLGLRWTSINLPEDFIRVKRQKTGVEAVIPISKACRAALEECRSRRVVGEHVFLTEMGKPYAISVLTRYFQRAKRIAGITRRFRFHDLRHSFASNLSSRGVPNQLIAKALGHSSVRMTEGYARPSEAALEIVRRALDDPPPTEVASDAPKPRDGESKSS